jgi:SAM-dependent methyltransferase
LAFAGLFNVSSTTDYANRFQAKADVVSYESEEYGAGSYSSCIWELQRPVVTRLLQDFQKTKSAPVRLLDFACGTGRVLTALAPLVGTATGVDISANMAALAQAKCPSAKIRVGDVLSEPELLGREPYDAISCFRFVLNAEPELRRRVLCRLREVLSEPDGLLLVNVHGNARSLRHPAIAWKRRRTQSASPGVMLNEMSPGEAEELLRATGFDIVRQYGFGIMPPTFYRTPLRGLAGLVDRSLAGENWWSNAAIDLLYVCRPGRRASTIA